MSLHVNRNPLTLLLSTNETAVLTDLFLAAGVPVTAKEIALRFKMSQNTVGDCLTVLEAHGLVDRLGRYAWAISASGVKHFIPVDNTLENDGDVDNSVITQFFGQAGITLRAIPDHSQSDPPYMMNDDHKRKGKGVDNFDPAVAEALEKWGFVDGPQFAASYPTIAPKWLEWADTLTESAIENFRNGKQGVGGMIRNGCRRGENPPLPATSEDAVCDDCGRKISKDGECLVCAGVVRT